MASSTSEESRHSFVDIGANLLDDRYQGVYRGTERHASDLDAVLERATETGVKHVIVTAGTLEESRQAVEFCRHWNQQRRNQQENNTKTLPHFSCTVGVHPTRCAQQFTKNRKDNDESILQQLVDIALDGKADGTVVAVGEMGLDYDRLQFCPKDTQRTYFIRQLETLAQTTQLPLFLHNRNVGTDLYDILVEYQHCWTNGVIHSFDDSIELANQFLQFSTDGDTANSHQLYIGLNGCSLRTEANLETVRQLPMDRLLLETDCPYCDIRATHAGHEHVQTTFPSKAEKKFQAGLAVKNRQEPCHIIQVAEVVAGVQQMDLRHVTETVYRNSLQLFGLDERDDD